MDGGALIDVEASVNIAYGYGIRGEIVGETDVALEAAANGEQIMTFMGNKPALNTADA